MNLFFNNSLGLLLLITVLSACQYRGPVADDKQAGQTKSAKWLSGEDYPALPGAGSASKSPQWRYAAKVGLTTASLKEQANLVWRFHDQSNDVRIFGPLGVGALKLEFDRYSVQLSDNKGTLHRGESAEALLTEIVGWPLPIDALSYWLFVSPAPGHAFHYRLNEQGQISSLRQLGWQIDYTQYRLYSDQLLPAKLTAFKQFAGKKYGAVTVKLITKSWEW